MNMTGQIVLSLAVLSLGIVALVAALKVFSSPAVLQKLSFARGLAPQQARLRCVAALPLGPRQKILLLEVDGERILLGVTAHSITPVLMSAAHAPVEAPSAIMPEPAFNELLQKWLGKSAKQEAA